MSEDKTLDIKEIFTPFNNVTKALFSIAKTSDEKKAILDDILHTIAECANRTRANLATEPLNKTARRLNGDSFEAQLSSLRDY